MKQPNTHSVYLLASLRRYPFNNTINFVVFVVCYQLPWESTVETCTKLYICVVCTVYTTVFIYRVRFCTYQMLNENESAILHEHLKSKCNSTPENRQKMQYKNENKKNSHNHVNMGLWWWWLTRRKTKMVKSIETKYKWMNTMTFYHDSNMVVVVVVVR